MATPQEHAKYADHFLVIAKITRVPNDIISLAVAGDSYWKAAVQAAQAAQGQHHPDDDQPHIRLNSQIRNVIGRAGFQPHQQRRLRTALNNVILKLHGASYEPHRIQPEHFSTYAGEAEYLTAMLLAKAPR